ncbi:hypothetical protein ACFYZ5_35255 [Streptomyces chartreusis]|uniref:hypothetical protein n=1 Tax=Streptomyces chartreusis TaxID=1969 RepID=UPI0036B00DA0
MTYALSDQLDMLAHQREDLDAERRRIQKAYCLAVLDHISAKVRRACPEAHYIGFAYHGTTRELGLLGVLGTENSPLSGLPWLWEVSDEQHRLAEFAAEIEADVQTALEPFDSPAWATVRRDSASEGNLWLVELPPPDRATRIAELVREHHPQATAVVVDGHSGGGRVITVIEGSAGDGTKSHAQGRWTGKCDDALARLVAQVFALPALADRHLVPTDSSHGPNGDTPSDRVRLMPLPPAP